MKRLETVKLVEFFVQTAGDCQHSQPSQQQNEWMIGKKRRVDDLLKPVQRRDKAKRTDERKKYREAFKGGLFRFGYFCNYVGFIFHSFIIAAFRLGRR